MTVAAVPSDDAPARRWVRRGPARKGTVRIVHGIRSPELGNVRDLFVYLPAGYEFSGRDYPVVYLQDGQNLFDPRYAFAGSWHADEAAASAARLGAEAILVGVANTGATRLAEYSPFPDWRMGGGEADRYLTFLVRRVKPLVDAEFRTRRGREHTVIGGSSMGGLLALYAFFRHPETFGRASVQSPALWFARAAIFDYVAAAPFVPGRLYLDVGQREGRPTLENARRMRDLLEEKGFRIGQTLRWLEDPRGTHQEHAWGRRLRKALAFLVSTDISPRLQRAG